jgi:hypothetical protein
MMVSSYKSTAVMLVPTYIFFIGSNASWKPETSTTLPVDAYKMNVDPAHTVSALVSISVHAHSVRFEGFPIFKAFPIWQLDEFTAIKLRFLPPFPPNWLDAPLVGVSSFSIGHYE